MDSATFDVASGRSTAIETSDGETSEDSHARLRALFAEHYDFIWRTLRRLGLDSGRADDGAQQVFVITSRKLSEIRVGEEQAYLFGIALRVASDARRATATRREQGWEAVGEAIDPAPHADEMIDQRRARELLDEVLAALPMDLRVVFMLHELEELSMSEIAGIVGIPAGTVASRLRRAREEFETAVARLNRGMSGERRGDRR